jgi:hypothetical protein
VSADLLGRSDQPGVIVRPPRLTALVHVVWLASPIESQDTEKVRF